MMRTAGWLLAGSFVFALSACEQQAEPVTEAAPTPSDPAPATTTTTPADVDAPKAPESTPVTACNAIVEAAKAKDADKILANSTEATKEVLADARAKDGVMAILGGATCGEATVEGEKAKVAMTSGADKRDVSFAKVGTDWKFDAKAYMEAYPPAPEKGKKGKKAKAKKAKTKA